MMTFPVKSGMSSRLNLLWGGKVCPTIEAIMPIVSRGSFWRKKGILDINVINSEPQPFSSDNVDKHSKCTKFT